MFRLIDRLTRWPKTVLLVALAITAAMAVAGGGVADRLLNGGTDDPSSESARATQMIDDRFPGSTPNFALLVTAGGDATVDDIAVADAAVALATRLAGEAGVSGVTSYWSTETEALRSEDRKQALIVARLIGEETEEGRTLARIAPTYRGTHGPIEVSIGGAAAIRAETEATVMSDNARAELIVLPLTLLILVLVFGSLIAGLLPIVVGVMTIICTNGVLFLISGVTDVSVFAQSLATALGLGLSIDFALLMVRRFREERQHGLDPREAAVATIHTAGRTAAFSALTVAVALSAMLVFPLYFLRSFAYAGVAVVLLCAAVVLIVLPAALVLLGDRVDSLDLRRLVKRRRRREGPTFFHRFVVGVTRRPGVVTVVVVALLALLALPFAGVRFGPADQRQLPVSLESRSVADAVEERFPEQSDATIDLLIEVGDPEPGLHPFVTVPAQLSVVDGVYAVIGPTGTFVSSVVGLPPTPVDVDRISAPYLSLTIIPDEGITASSPEAWDLVQRLRTMDLGYPVSVTGPTATLHDSQAAIAERLPLALGLIVVATLVLVFLFTGGVLVSVLTVLFSALSLTVMFGASVWIFQEGNGAALLGFDPIGEIETTLPVLMFCLTFGLSMDYGVIVISRIKEEYDRHGDHQRALTAGLSRTAGLVTAAALILGVVLLAMGSSRITNMKMLGIGVALAVLMDATVIRSLLLPAVLTLTGRATWWAPPLLRRFQHRYGLREEQTPVVPPEPVPDLEPGAEPEAAGAGAR